MPSYLLKIKMFETALMLFGIKSVKSHISSYLMMAQRNDETSAENSYKGTSTLLM